MEETRWEGQNFSEVVASQEEEEEEEEEAEEQEDIRILLLTDYIWITVVNK
jgi:hypothetical protein